MLEWTKPGGVSLKDKNHWEKKVPHVSHQGVLWAQEPRLLLGMGPEQNRWGKRSQRLRCLPLSDCQQLYTSFLPLYPCIPQEEASGSGCHLLWSCAKEEGTTGASRAISSFSICSWNQRQKGRTKTMLTLGLLVNIIRYIVFIVHLWGNSHLYTLFLMHKIKQPCEIHCMHKETDIKKC